MSRQSTVLLSGVPPVVIYVGEPVRVDLWYTNTQVQHTLQVVASNFRGRLSIQASIKVKPFDCDWFTVNLNGRPFINYPRNGIGTNGNSNLGGFSGGTSFLDAGYGGLGAETSTLGYSFAGHFIWMRAIIDRSRVVPIDANPIMVGACGSIDRILVNI
jgi:hypothetical protein